MGLDKNYSKNVQKGFSLFEDLLEFVSPQEDDVQIDHSGEYEEQARMMELDARAKASGQQRQAESEARATRAELETTRARANTEWGRSNLAMDGSSELVREAQLDQDARTENYRRFTGDMAARETMDKGMREANLHRIARGLGPSQSTLSLGSTIYKYGR